MANQKPKKMSLAQFRALKKDDDKVLETIQEVIDGVPARVVDLKEDCCDGGYRSWPIEDEEENG